MKIHKQMTNEEMGEILNEHWKDSGYVFPTHFEHRLESTSSAMMYALIREYKPKNAVHLGTSRGGSACIIMSALIANKNPFTYVASELLDDLREETRKHVIEKCGVAPVMVGNCIENLDKYPLEIDFLFHDTDHDRETTEWVFKHVIPRLKKGALVIFHDWAVAENEKGEWWGKGDNGIGGWPETEYMLELHRAGTLPLEKVYFNYELGSGLETGVFLKT